MHFLIHHLFIPLPISLHRLVWTINTTQLQADIALDFLGLNIYLVTSTYPENIQEKILALSESEAVVGLSPLPALSLEAGLMKNHDKNMQLQVLISP